MNDKAHNLVAALRFHKHPLTQQAANRISELEEALAAEREACAAIACPAQLALSAPTHGVWDRGYEAGRKAAAAEIRARST